MPWSMNGAVAVVIDFPYDGPEEQQGRDLVTMNGTMAASLHTRFDREPVSDLQDAAHSRRCNVDDEIR